MTRADALKGLAAVGMRWTDKPTVTKSLLGDFSRCERAAFFRHWWGLVRGQTPGSMFFGTMVHKALEVLVSGGSVDMAEAAIAKMIAAEVLNVEGSIRAGYKEGLVEQGEKALACADGFNFLLNEKARKRGDIIATEQALTGSVEVYGNDVGVAGTIDLLVANDGAMDIYDYKTTQDSPAEGAEAAEFSPQTELYRALVEKNFPGWPVRRMVYYRLAVPGIKRKLVGTGAERRRETMQEYCDRVKQWYRDRQTEKPEDPPLARIQVNFSVEGLSQSLKARIDRVRLACYDGSAFDVDAFPMTGASHECRKRGRTCQYLPLCSTEKEPALWPLTISSQYRQEFRYDDGGEEAG